MAQQYSLKWNNHQPNFISMFAMLRNTQALVDVTLAAEGRHLHAHKMVLSACSPYFHSLFVENPSRHPIVILKDVAFSDLRTIVDFMYYGEVNITQEELPQMLHSAKSLKVKGLTETESTSVMRSQSSDFPYETANEVSEQTGEPSGEQASEPSNEPSAEAPSDQPHDGEPQRRTSASPANSPSAKRRRRRRSSNGSTSLNMMGEENRDDNQSMEIVRDGITVSSVPRRRDFAHDNTAQQNTEPQNISIDDLNVDHNPGGMPLGGQWSMMEHAYPRYSNSCFGGGALAGEGGGMYMSNMMHLEELMSGLRLKRAKHLKRQPRIEERAARRQVSEPTAQLLPPPVAAPSSAALRKHHSYPQFAPRRGRARMAASEQHVGSLLIRAVTVLERQSSAPSDAPAPPPPPPPPPPPAAHASREGVSLAARASHTPAVRSGPPLSCNFCWNTVDECGRILRRKTQYHCPECRTNLCIVPCFHEYHDAETEVANVR